MSSATSRVLGQVRAELMRRGVTDVAQVAEELQRIKEEHARARLYASDLYTEHGSDTFAAGDRKNARSGAALRMTQKPRAMSFSTGYAANLGALSALPGPKDLLLLDPEAHASMIDVAKLSAKRFYGERGGGYCRELGVSKEVDFVMSTFSKATTSLGGFIFFVPVVYPAVAENEGRIRFIVNAQHTRAQIEHTVSRLAYHAREIGALESNTILTT